MRRALLLVVGLAFVLAPMVAICDDTAIEVLSIRNRPAADLVAPLEAVLGEEATVTAFNGKLIVRAPRRLLPEVRRLVAQLDFRPRSLRITVRQGRDLETRERSAGATIVAGPRGGAVGGHVAQGQETDVSHDVHHVRALEGTPAWITLDESVPVPAAVVAPTAGGAAIVSGTTYHQVDRGFWVVARVAGEQVTLEIETALDEAHPGGVVETQGVRTSTSGRLGEWISLGGIAQQATARGSGILSIEQSKSSDLRTVEVRVDETP